MNELLSDSDLERITGESRTTRWRKIRRGLHPGPVNIGSTAAPRNRWPKDEIDTYIAALRAGHSLAEATQAAAKVRQSVIEAAGLAAAAG